MSREKSVLCSEILQQMSLNDSTCYYTCHYLNTDK